MSFTTQMFLGVVRSRIERGLHIKNPSLTTLGKGGCATANGARDAFANCPGEVQSKGN
jgi:hypothetical protein